MLRVTFVPGIAALAVAIAASAPPLRAQDTIRISVDASGNETASICQAFRHSAAIVNGEPLVVFHSTGSDLVKVDGNNRTDVFLRNLATDTTTRIVSDFTGGETDGHSSGAQITPDGRFVFFESSATDVVKGDNNAVQDVFVLDRGNGAVLRASLGDGGVELDQFSVLLDVSDDGNFVLFATQSTNADPNDANGTTDLFVHDRARAETTLVSATPAGTSANNFSLFGAITADGTTVAFQSFASDLVPNDSNGLPDIFVRDLAAGVTTRVSVNDAGFELDRSSSLPAISEDGTLVAFQTAATNLHRDSTGGIHSQVFVRDLATGELWLASRGVDGLAADGNCDLPVLFTRPAAAGPRAVVAFRSSATNLFDDGFVDRDNFVVDFRAGIGQCASVDSLGVDHADSPGMLVVGAPPGGEFLVMTTDGSTLAPGDGDTTDDLYVRGLQWTMPTEFGVGLAGSAGYVPHLKGRGGSCEDGRWSIELVDGLGGANGHLWVGLGRTNGFKLFGGTFYLDFSQPFFAIPIALGGAQGVAGAGELFVSGANVENLGQFSIFLQSTLLDPNAVRGVSISNALEIAIDANPWP